MKLYNRAQTKQQISNQVGKWIPWYWENKLGMIGWTQKGPDQPYYGVELEVIALISELHTVLPKNLPATRLMRLVDGRGRTIFQSGDLEIKEGLQPALRLPIGENYRTGKCNCSPQTAPLYRPQKESSFPILWRSFFLPSSLRRQGFFCAKPIEIRSKLAKKPPLFPTSRTN